MHGSEGLPIESGLMLTTDFRAELILLLQAPDSRQFPAFFVPGAELGPAATRSQRVPLLRPWRQGSFSSLSARLLTVMHTVQFGASSQ